MSLHTRPRAPIVPNLLVAVLLLLGGVSFLARGHVLVGVLSVVTGVGYVVLSYVIWRGPRVG